MRYLPSRDKRIEFCITVEREGVYFYGNRQAFQRLAEEMKRIAESDPAEHYHCHVISLAGYYDTSLKRKRVFVLVDKTTRRVFKPSSRWNLSQGEEIGLTFMAVEPKDLRELRTLERRGVVPEGWRELDQRKVPKKWRADK